MNKLFFKIFLSTLLAITLLTSLILFFSLKNIRDFYIDAITEELTNLNYSSIYHFRELILNKEYDELESYVEDLGTQIEKRITIVDTSGIVLADSKTSAETMENHKARPEIIDAIKGNTGKSLRFSTTINDDMLYVAIPIIYDSDIIAVSRFSVFVSSIDELTSKVSYDIIKISFVLIIFIVVGIIIFTRNIVKPINDLSDASRKLASGDFKVKVEPKRNDEIYHLSKNFNDMTDKLNELFSQVNTQKEEYHTLISSIQEGLLVIDFNDSIILSNMSFNSFVRRGNIIGEKYFDVIDNDIIEEIIDNTKYHKINTNREVCIDKNTFLISSNYIESKNEIVLLFHNITEIKNLERIKKDFVVNVSHELRTPLTAIKGFVETLEEEIEDETNQRYINIIRRHTDRLINIVQDLLILSEVEEENTKLMLTKVDLKFLLNNLILIFDQKLRNKHLELMMDIEPNFPKILVDAFRIEQVFINLIDNAIKYTDEGCIKITVKKINNFAHIKISDSGIGISADDISRVFERFYLVDKSRSSKVGGSGLGLSIVKHIILLHNGTIEVKSEKNKGTEFIIKLPL
jgi:two-component system phosphate regulon sensor histidine kinase PhoR